METVKVQLKEMFRFEPITKYKPGIIFSLLSESFADVMDEKLKNKIRQFDADVFGNPDTVGPCVFISTLNGRSVGMASWNPQKGPEFAVIGFNCVLPEFQGNGLGKSQIKRLLGRFKLNGFEKAFVRTAQHPFYTAAQKMYTACGFRKTKRSGGDTIDYEIRLNIKEDIYND